MPLSLSHSLSLTLSFSLSLSPSFSLSLFSSLPPLDNVNTMYTHVYRSKWMHLREACGTTAKQPWYQDSGWPRLVVLTFEAAYQVATLVKHESWTAMMDSGRDPREGNFLYRVDCYGGCWLWFHEHLNNTHIYHSQKGVDCCMYAAPITNKMDVSVVLYLLPGKDVLVEVKL